MNNTFTDKIVLDKERISSDNPPLVALPLEGIEMIRITLHYFYNIGTQLQPLKTLEQGQKMMDVYSELLDAEAAVQGLLRSTIMPLRTCYETGEQLLNALDAVTSADLSTKEELNWGDVYSITNAVEKFETVLSAELQTLDTYFVSQKGGYSTIDLIADAEILIPDSVRIDMSSEAIVDFRSGGRCLAFDLPTAAGFHLLRAIESVLHAYYDEITTSKTIAPNATMGMYITHLEAHGGEAKVMAVLRQITNLHRNPLMHPQDTLTANQALVLIGIIVSAITAMIEGMQQKRAAATATSTPIPVVAVPASAAVVSSVPGVPVPPPSAAPATDNEEEE